MVLIIPILILLCIFVHIRWTLQYIDKIYSKKEIREFLSDNNDMYVESMSEYDLKARGVSTSKDYIEKIKNVGYEPTLYEQYILGSAMQRADSFLNTLNHKLLPDDHNIDRIKWNIALTDSDDYEEGFPHTRNKIIFLPRSILKSENIVSTLIHEKIHVYQRFNRLSVEKVLTNNGYTNIGYKHNVEKIRTNPDINNFLYTDQEGKKMMLVYTSDNPENINDVKQYGEYEHPYEMISYVIENIYKENVKNEFPNIR